MKRVSVVILNWNGVDMLRTFIPSVMDNSVGEGIEICVADNASSDGSVSYTHLADTVPFNMANINWISKLNCSIMELLFKQLCKYTILGGYNLFFTDKKYEKED